MNDDRKHNHLKVCELYTKDNNIQLQHSVLDQTQINQTLDYINSKLTAQLEYFVNQVCAKFCL